jgi:two-component system response regulator DesR
VTIRLLLADDQALVRGALATLLDLEPDMSVVAEVGRGDEVVAAAREAKPDVALLDVEMPGVDGIEATRELRAALPDVKVVIVTTFGRPGFLRRALIAGANGFVVKDTPARQLADAVRRVHSGLRVVDPNLAADSLAVGESPLTARETEVLRAARDGGQCQRHRRRGLPLRGNRPQPPLGRDRQDRRTEPRGRGPDRPGERLAVIAGDVRRTRLVLVHGSRLSATQWVPQTTRLADAADVHPWLEVVTPDLPGHGGRSHEPFTLDRAVGALAAAVEAEPGPDLVVLAGHSLGGYVAATYAATFPRRLDGLVLLGSAAVPRGAGAAAYRAVAALTERAGPDRMTRVNDRVLGRLYAADLVEPVVAGGYWFTPTRTAVARRHGALRTAPAASACRAGPAGRGYLRPADAPRQPVCALRPSGSRRAHSSCWSLRRLRPSRRGDGAVTGIREGRVGWDTGPAMTTTATLAAPLRIGRAHHRFAGRPCAHGGHHQPRVPTGVP